MEDLIQLITLADAIVQLITGIISLVQEIKLCLNSPANPAHDEHGLAVADRLVARPVWAFVGGLAAIGDARVVTRKALEPFALARGEAPNLGVGQHCLDFSPSLHGVSMVRLHTYAIRPAGRVLAECAGLNGVSYYIRTKPRICVVCLLPVIASQGLSNFSTSDYWLSLAGLAAAR